jgi:hypothetical protein
MIHFPHESSRFYRCANRFGLISCWSNTCAMMMSYCARSRRLVAGFLPRPPGFEHRSGHVGFVVNKVSQGQVFSEYLSFSCQFSFHRLLHTHYHLSSGAGPRGQLVDDVPSGLCLTPPQETKKKSELFRGLLRDAVQEAPTESNDGMVDELERIWKEADVAQQRYSLGNCFEQLRKTRKTPQ